MVTVYIWLPNTRLSLGHAAMKIARNYSEEELAAIRKDFPSFSAYHETYISWWPIDKGFFTPRRFLDGVAHTYEQDISNAYEARDPEWSTRIYTLDEPAMEKAWLGFKYDLPKPNWHATQNCATIVARLLRVGGGHFFLGDNVIWTPRQVMQYACQIASRDTVCKP